MWGRGHFHHTVFHPHPGGIGAQSVVHVPIQRHSGLILVILSLTMAGKGYSPFPALPNHAEKTYAWMGQGGKTLPGAWQHCYRFIRPTFWALQSGMTM